jgi:hypothetical protein
MYSSVYSPLADALHQVPGGEKESGETAGLTLLRARKAFLGLLDSEALRWNNAGLC